MNIEPIDELSPLAELKEAYVRQATAPLDGMWLTGFAPMASHFAFRVNDHELAGYCCVNDEGYMLQFFVAEAHQHLSSTIFATVTQDRDSPAGAIRGAFVSTAEPRYFSLCLDAFPHFTVNALMYQRDATPSARPDADDLPLRPVVPAELPQAIDFAVASIGAPIDWLRGYYGNLVRRQELFGVWADGELVATGESRGYDALQTAYVDVGVVVSPSERGKGLATRVLRKLVTHNETQGLKSICSTEEGNIAAQKAITRAGFFASNRIVRFEASSLEA